jgi:chromosome segregation ATPase
MVEIRNDEEASRTIEGLNRQIENRQSILARIRLEKESRMSDFDNQIKREGDELARLEAQMVEMKRQLHS